MDLLPSPEQQAVADTAAAYLRAELPIGALRQRLGSPLEVDQAAWAACAALGWFGLGLPEAAGGAGCGPAEEVLLFREIGRHLAAGPYLSTVLGARIAAAAGRADLTAAIVEGTAPVGLAEPRPDPSTSPRPLPGAVRPGPAADAGAGGPLDPAISAGPQPDAVGPGRPTDAGAAGRLDAGLDAGLDLYDWAGTDLVVVATPDGAGLYETAALSDVTTYAGLDPATGVGTGRAEGLQPEAFVGPGRDRVYLLGVVLASAMACGVAEATRDLAAEHARTRVQYGRPIGVNQGVKHPCADMAVRSEAATSQTFLAALALAEDHPDAAFQVTAAKVVASDAALRNSRATVQVHGGMGFTWDHDAHLFAKRARVLGQIFGDRRQSLARLLALAPAR